MPLGIHIELFIREVSKFPPQLKLRRRDALFPIDGRMSARKNHFSFPVKRPKQLAFPAVPDTGTHSLDIADGQNQEELEPFQHLHCACKILDGFGIGNITVLSDI